MPRSLGILKAWGITQFGIPNALWSFSSDFPEKDSKSLEISNLITFPVCKSSSNRLQKQGKDQSGRCKWSCSLEWWPILSSDRAHFDQASTIFDSNSGEAWGETRWCHEEWALDLKRSNRGGGRGRKNTPAGGHCFFEKCCLSTNRVCNWCGVKL